MLSRNTVLETLARVTREILELSESAPIEQTDSLRELGANSVDRADILTDAMDELGIWTSPIDFAAAQNIADIIDVLMRTEVAS
ncbi:MAG: phosphopantetheine-binding protein [Cutibacterium avidum]|nr:phosphopantetheine-binding protein [Cutibacterium avidum]MBS5745274.1 hypothetical protein [Propionibacterium sp.]MDK7358911.1 phosphopantetheine-binding protein [Cutibacterium avidum]MDK7372105.1 phosphopantetheine-binding protein [Cutibacterium avidum]MDU2073087.1 phosphopantetheine-binding protein [Cutibacterium avidum]MDU3219728.1 phosphopantetheine-binding protein [Cutibacterium avidum]